MPMIRVEMFKGRNAAQKRALVQELTEAFVRAAGGTPESVQVMLVDVDKGDWAAGGQMWSDKLAE